MKRSILCCATFVVFFLAASAGYGQLLPLEFFVYTVDVDCSSSQPNLPFTLANNGVGETTETTVEIHNYSVTNVQFNYRVLQPQTSASAGFSFPPVLSSLQLGSALSLDCSDFIILQQGQAGINPATKGLVVIESTVELRVSAIYKSRILAAAQGDEFFGPGVGVGAGTSIHVEYIEPRKRPIVLLQP